MNPERQLPMHHPSEALLLSHAAGSLGEAEALAVSTHLTLCPHCRRLATAAESIGGALLERITPAEMSAGSLQAALTRLDGPETPRPATAPHDAAWPGLPRALAGYAAAARATSGWRMAGPGVQQLRLATGGDAQARLLRLKPGTPLPRHTHRGCELTLVLSGSYSDELGHFARGDLAELDETIDHRPVVDQGETCVALVVTDAPLKFRGLLARIAQPFVGI